MPSKYNKVSLPDPKNDQVYTEEMMQTTAAVLRFSGNANQQLLDKKTALLLKWVETSGYKISSKPKYLFYNPPATPGFLKRNEVMLVVNSEKTDDWADYGNKINQTKIEKVKWMNSRNISRFQTMAQECKITIFRI